MDLAASAIRVLFVVKVPCEEEADGPERCTCTGTPGNGRTPPWGESFWGEAVRGWSKYGVVL